MYVAMIGEEPERMRPKHSSQLTSMLIPGSMYIMAPGTDVSVSAGLRRWLRICMSAPSTSYLSGSRYGTTTDMPGNAMVVG